MKETEKRSVLGPIIIILSIAIMVLGIMLVVMNAEPMRTGMVVLGAVIALLGLITLCYLLTIYNRLVNYRNKVKESLSSVDVHLKQRFDMIPNLVSVVKGYAKHEKEVFAEITELRNIANNAKNEKDKIDCANKILPKMRQIIALAENYPKLKADALFANLMEELVLIEDKIVAARRFYDSNVNMYNTLVESMPSGLIAKMYKFERTQLFTIDTGERLNVKINLE